MNYILISSESRYPVEKKKIKEKVDEILKKLGLDEVEVSIAIVGNRKIRQLNRDFRKIDEPTDVLSFPLIEPRGEDGILRLGDIVISFPQARVWAMEKNKMVNDVILELIEHGLNNLLKGSNDNRP